MESSIEFAEAFVMAGVLWLRLVVEVSGALMIGFGVLASFAQWTRGILQGRDGAFGDARLKLARYLALALELQLGADILSTAIAPTWDQIGKLAAIAVIRTALNYFLRRELGDHEQAAAKAAA